ncbi:hypothetical protein TMO_3479 [Tistrella mobilis KA081020-065]|uniref:Uncharacterized protein n=1 Tax=Tistrella mobilis (strain KA081020-065) TaxID=1110502 RepID=I3TRC9_TISMK|nr:hypothetical protein TMO_3479 [Tistrella mobilis KA081020-065]
MVAGLRRQTIVMRVSLAPDMLCGDHVILWSVTEQACFRMRESRTH